MNEMKILSNLRGPQYPGNQPLPDSQRPGRTVLGKGTQLVHSNHQQQKHCFQKQSLFVNQHICFVKKILTK